MALSVQERRKEISHLLKSKKLKNSELAERLHVSVSTIVSDKKALRAEKKNTDNKKNTTPPHVEEQHNPVEHAVKTKPVIKNESHEKSFNKSEQYNRAADIIIGFASGVIAFAIIVMIFG